MKEITHGLNHDLTFSAHTIKCVCHSIRSIFRVLGIYNFGKGLEKKRQWHLIHIQWELNHNFGRWSYLMAFLDKHGICRGRNMSDRLGALIVLINWSDIRHNWFKNYMMKWHLNLVAQIEVLSLFRLLYSSTSIVQRLEISRVQNLEISRLCTLEISSRCTIEVDE